MTGPRGRDEPALLCFDLGLTHAKAVLFAPDGAMLDRASFPYPTRRPRSDRVEQEPDDWWAAFRQGIDALRVRSAPALARVAGIGVTAHMHALVAIGPDGRSLGPALTLGDRRALAESAEIEAAAGGAAWVWRVTGTTMDPTLPAAELAWLRRHDPDRFRMARVFLGAKDALRHRLTGDLPAGPALTEPIDACATSLYDIRAADWSEPLLEVVGVERSRLPEVRAPWEFAGPLAAGPAGELGLRAGVPVAVGAGDDVEVLGCGLLDPGEALEHLGTTGSIYAVLDGPRDDPTLALELYPHVVPGRWVVGGSLSAAGAAIAWAARTVGYRAVEAAFDDALGGREGPGATGAGPLFIPSLAGERVPVRDPLARGAILDLGLELDRRAIIHAVCEGVAIRLRRILDAVEALAGPQRRVSVSAGGSDLHPAWLALRAALYGRPLVRRTTTEPTALGLATIVATAIGLHPDVPAAVRAMTAEAETIQPPAARRANGRLQRADRALEALRPAWPIVAAIDR